MKTAVSPPDPVFHAAEDLAKRLGVPRSRRYARATVALVKENRNEGVTEVLNRVYGGREGESELDPVLEAIQTRSLRRERW